MAVEKAIQKTAIVILWLIIWQLLADAVHNPILLVGPVETLHAFLDSLAKAVFWKAVAGTTTRVVGGFLTGGLAGVLCAGVSFRFRWMRELLAPCLSVIRSIPIVSFVILLLIWQGSGMVSFWISLLVVFPILYGNTLNGLLGMREELVCAAKLLPMRWHERVFGIYLPEIYPELKSGLELAAGMGFKSGIAAEVIGQPVGSIGNALYQSKIFLETDAVLAYTLTAVCVAWIVEKTVVWIWGYFFGRRD
ncbi:MAG: ABC transporter permease subunit [Lachnospiraceae bacterium]|nr:ABC transporter permease subunit [Lachnospiraceae bacterium]